MTWTIPTPPAVDNTAVDAIRQQVREASLQFDAELQAKLTYAIGVLQENCNIQYYQTQAVYRADAFPGTRYDRNCWYPWTLYATSDARFLLPPSPLVSVESVTYDDTDGNNQTLPSADYEVITDERPGFIRPVSGKSWPTGTNIVVNYTVGFGTVWAEMPPNQAEPALELGERYYRGSLPDNDDLRRLFNMASVGDEFTEYVV